MRLGLVTCLFFVSLTTYAVDVDSTRAWNYTTANGETNSVQIYDTVGQVGEEVLTWQVGGEIRNVQVTNVTDDSYDGEYVVQDHKKFTLMNYSLGLTTGRSYKKTLAFLKIASFRAAFEEIPAACEDNADAFLTVTDNQNSKMYGYCLIPQN